MCIAIYQPRNVCLSDEELRTAWSNNPDGAGFAYVSDGRIVTYRTMHLRKLMRAYRDAVANHGASSHMMVHFRLATHGTTTIDNVHPFAQDAHTMIVHNGILPTPTIADGRSDTATFVQDYLPRLGATWFDDERLHHMVSEYCAGSKLIVMTTNPDANYGAYIINERTGHWDHRGMWFSNRSHEACSVRTRSWGGPRPTIDEDDDAWLVGALCPLCDADAVDNDPITGALVCFDCYSCVSCGWEADQCACVQTPRAPRLHTITDTQWASTHRTLTLWDER